MEFGRLTASLSGKPFSGGFGPDSTVAAYNQDVGQLQIEGGRRIGEWSEVVRLVMICDSIPERGSYPIASQLSPVSAGVYKTRLRRWLPRSGRTTTHFFISDSMPQGVLNLDSLDLAAGIIRGRFSVGVRTFNQKPADTLFVTGAFSGRVRTTRRMASTRPIRWTPLQGRDCKGVKTRE